MRRWTRSKLAATPIKLPPPDPDAELYDGRYNDDLFGTELSIARRPARGGGPRFASAC